MYSGKKIHKTGKSPHQCYFKSGDAEISRNKEYSNFICDVDNYRYISDRRSVTYTFYLFDDILIYWCDNKKSETSRSSSNSETKEMYIGVIDKNCIRYFFTSIGYLIGPQ